MNELIIEQLRRDVEDSQATLAQYRDEFEQLPERIKAADRAALHGPADQIQSALTEKKNLIERQGELDILIFRVEEAILKLEAQQVEERLKPLADQIEAAIVAETEAEEAFIAAQTRLTEAQARRRQLEHDRESLTRQGEKALHSIYAHRNEHTRKTRATNG